MIRSATDSQDDDVARHSDPTVGCWLNVEPFGYEADGS